MAKSKKKVSRKGNVKDGTLLVPRQDFKEWTPILNGAFLDLKDKIHLNDTEKDNLTNSSLAILKSCMSPDDEGVATGLVIGHVQSGKTMSFTALAALARDNGYQVLIIITGTTVSLSEQSVERLNSDLKLKEKQSWIFLNNPKETEASNIQSKLDLWKDGGAPSNLKSTILFSVSKHHKHIENLTKLLRKLDLTTSTAIIIDDEADQASLNSKVNRTAEQSTTYSRILDLRRAIPHHTYLQYTATPQAPLLINKIDLLSPRFVELLQPGEQYIGGQEIFDDGLSKYLIEIPSDELPDTWVGDGPPPSLEESLKIFLIGACIEISKSEPERRSMMIHPSQSRSVHETYFKWVRYLMDNWYTALQSKGHASKEVKSEFKNAYDELSKTEDNIPDFKSLFGVLKFVIKSVQLEEVNSRLGKTPKIQWGNSLFHILVGGQAMDRGYTVEGLTVTYMPRGRGIGNADTIQQRARFFGYKRKYLGICRIFLESGVQDSFKNYVDHEKDLRKRLIAHNNSGKPLNEWKRNFFLDQSLRPTRSSVIDVSYARGDFADQWVSQEFPSVGGEELVSHNRRLVEILMQACRFAEWEGQAKRTIDQRHEFADVSLSDLYEKFLVNYRFGESSDSEKMTGLLLQVESMLERVSDLGSCVINMSFESKKNRVRRVGGNERIKELFQGRSRDGKRYPGDRMIKFSELFCVQLHLLDLKMNDQIFMKNVPTLGIWVPDSFRNAWLVE
jgi:hypothetical protein